MHNFTHPHIAVIGLGCQYPGAENIKTLWENILARRQQFRLFPDQRLPLAEYYSADRSAPDKTYGTRGAFIDGFEFDWAKRRIPKSVVESTDLVHWLALEVALQAIQNAGYEAATLPAERTCVFVGNTLTGEHTRSNSMRMRWPFVRRALEAAAGSRMTETELSELSGAMEYYYKSVLAPVTEDTLAGGLSNTIAGRICNFLNLNGGGYTVDGACSSSLLAIANAAAAIANGEMDMALAGGVDMSLDTFEMIGFAKTGALTSGEMTVYDQKGSGFIPGEGCGFVVLKDLAKAKADGDTVYAVLRGWGISSDGKGGITAPKAQGQALALTRAYQRAGYAVQDLDFVEGHGTGTAVGDKVELSGIALAGANTGSLLPRSVGVTSFKSLVGHTKAAAGAGGFIKAVMAVNQRIIPPTAGCDEPHAIFNQEALGLYPVLEGGVHAPDSVMRAGVSAMGFGGINCHITVESGDAPSALLASHLDARQLLASRQNTELFLMAASTLPDLINVIEQLQLRAKGMSVAELCDLAAETTCAATQSIAHTTTQTVSQPAGSIRAAIIAESVDDLHQRLAILVQRLKQQPPVRGEVLQIQVGITVASYIEVQEAAQGTTEGMATGMADKAMLPRIGFLFPGQGSQQLNMARHLVNRHYWAREWVEQADAYLVENGFAAISPILFRPLERAFGTPLAEEWAQQLTDTSYAQVAICLASLIYAEYLRRLGIQPVAVAGHSLGELTALAIAGAMDIKTLILLAAERGKAMAEQREGAGSMASLICSEAQANAIMAQVPGYLTIACINSASQIVLAGEVQAVEAAVEIAHAQGIKSKRLPVSNAFHSRLIAHTADHLSGLEWLSSNATVTVPVVSAVDGCVISGKFDLNAYCAAQVVAPVRFVDMAHELRQRCDMLIEVGPGRVLTSLIAEIKTLKASTSSNIFSCFPVASRPDADQDINRLVGMLFTAGHAINTDVLYADRLVRPFIPATQRQFLDNPCERAFPADRDQIATMNIQPPTGAIQNITVPGLSEQQLSTYLRQRGHFIAQVIRADMESGVIAAPIMIPQNADKSFSPLSGTAAPLNLSDVPSSAWACLQSVVAEFTGFAVDSLSPQLRLLDDLNLDSIKAGELLGEVSYRLQLAGKLDPTTLLNATLSEVTTVLTALQPVPAAVRAEAVVESGKASAMPKLSIQDVLKQVVARRTGFTADSLHTGLRLVDDLNLDSIKVAELIAEVSVELNVAGKLDPVTLSNATLAEITAAFEVIGAATANTIAIKVIEGAAAPTVPATAQPLAISSAQPQIVTSLTMPEPAETWVRNFKVEWRAQSLDEALAVPSNFVQPQVLAKILILGEAESVLVKEVLAAYVSQGTQCIFAAYEDEQTPELMADSSFTDCVVILTAKQKEVRASDNFTFGQNDQKALSERVERLHCSILRPSTLNAASVINGQPVPQQQFYTLSYVVCGEQPGVRAFAASVHLERVNSKVRVVECPDNIQAQDIVHWLAAERAQPDAFMASRYDTQHQRYVLQPVLQHQGDYVSRSNTWSKDDVVLVTGGAKGITAECALVLAQKHGMRLALAGSSIHTIEQPNQDVAATLQRFQSFGLDARYYACDLTRQDAVKQLVHQVTQEMGSITGFIHGAGVNKPRRVETVSVASALQEIAPKLAGAQHVLNALNDTGSSLKIICAFTSIIGFTGMAGNAWYGFSNEALDDMVGRYQKAHPSTAVFSLGYSVWAEVGMGVRMGSTKHLGQMGIAAIPSEEGTQRFLKLWECEPGVRQVIVAARLGGLDTWNPPASKVDKACSLRFIEDVLHHEPGVELTVRVKLHPDRDLYLRDHNYRGSLLFPTVFGLEAMAQAIASVLGDTSFFQVGHSIAIEDIRLERPIVVPQDRGCVIQLHAQVEERQSKEAPVRVCVGIRTEQTGWRTDHFSAVFVLDVQDKSESTHAFEQTLLAIDPKHDLYGPLLFQGSRFQRIRGVYALKTHSEFVGEAVLDIEGKDSASNHHESFSTLSDSGTPEGELPEGTLLLGDPYLRDAVLQSGQLLIPQHLCLPIAIDRLIVRLQATTAGHYHLTTHLLGCTEKDVTADCRIVNRQGECVERLEGYRTRILDTLKQNPSVEELNNLSAWEEQRLQARIYHAATMMKITAPELAFAWKAGLHDLPRTERHEQEMELIQQAWQRRFPDQTMPEPHWLASGKPTFSDGKEGLSISHDNLACLVAIGNDSVGCDLAPVTTRSAEAWCVLLSEARMPLLEQLQMDGDTLDLAGTRIWAALETVIKAGSAKEIRLKVVQRAEDSVLLETLLKDGANEQPITILSLPFTSWRGTQWVIALTGQRAVDLQMEDMQPAKPIGFTEQQPIMQPIPHQPQQHLKTVQKDGSASSMSVSEQLYGKDRVNSWITYSSAKILHFHHRFHLLMDDIGSVGRTVPFSRYYAWMGKVREMALEPIMTELSQLISTGEWGAVTNQSDVHIFGEARGQDTLVGTVHAVRLPDSDESTMDLRFDWHKELPDGTLEPIASSAMRTSWVKIVGHGHVEKYPLPLFIRAFLDKTGEERHSHKALPIKGLATLERGTLLVSYASTFGAAPLLSREQFQTDQEDSNLVGNIYHSNYGKWQGRVRDRYLHQLAPDHFKGNGAEGEWICQQTRINYLRDAMPFDTVEVTMQLRELYQNAVSLSFAYYRVEADARRTKLAQGEQEMIWVLPAQGVHHSRLAAEIPAIWRNAFLQAGDERSAKVAAEEKEKVISKKDSLITRSEQVNINA